MQESPGGETLRFRFFAFPLLLLAVAHGISGPSLASLRALPATGASQEELPGGMGTPEGGTRKDANKMEARKPRDQATFHLRRDGVLVGRLRIDQVAIETRYGELRVPLPDVVQIRFARRIPEDLRKKVEGAILQLSDDDFDRREEATKVLREIGPTARAFIKEALNTNDEEVRNRAETLLSGLSGASPKEPVEAEEMDALGEADEDEVTTRRFTIKGRVLGGTYSVISAYGELKVSQDDLVGITFSGEMPVSRKVTVAATFMVPQQWYDTKTTLLPGIAVRLAAKGQIMVPNYSLSSGPEGTRRYSGSTFNNLPMLSLVGKIGKDGQPFLVGKGLRTKVKKAGKLYLGIVPFRRTYPATGSYEVKIDTGK